MTDAARPDERLPEPVVGALLAGGGSRRMGRDKGALELGGKPLAAHAAAALSGLCEACVQLGGSPPGTLGWQIIEDRRPDAGPAAALESGLLHFPGAALVVCAIDMPFVPAVLLRRLLATLQAGALAAAPHHAGRWHPLAAAYSPGLLPELTRRLDGGQLDLQSLLDARATALTSRTLEALGDPDRMLLNVNTPADLERARRLLRDPSEG